MKKAELQTHFNSEIILTCMIKGRKIIPLFFLFNLLNSLPSPCQSQYCTGSAAVPVLHETFGSGPNPGPALPPAITNYTYVNGWPSDGNYTIWNTSNPNLAGDPFWHTAPDHTGDSNGYMMVINASYAPGEFYRRTITGLCPNTTYIFSAWAANVNTLGVHSYCDPNYIFPDILFKIEDPTGLVLGSKASGKIPIDSNGLIWREYGFRFSSQNQSSVTLVMVNNAPGGCGNDLVLDDISFFICNPTVSPQIQPAKPAYCTGENITILGGLGPGYTNPQFQWQFSSDAGITWNDIPGATNQNLILNNLPLLPVTAQYRLIVAETGNILSPTCRIISPAVAVNVVAVPAMSILSKNIACFGGNDGSAIANVTGGTIPYKYAWSTIPISSTQNISGLAPGTYSLTVTDKYGCKDTASATITQPARLTITATSQTTVSCNGGNNGSASINVSGGTPNYSYHWSTGDTASAITGLSAGNYTVKVTDAKGCIVADSMSITQPANPLFYSISQTMVSCKGGNNGSASIRVSGGTPNYSYRWSTGDTASAINRLIAGSYAVKVTDAKGCIVSDSMNITQPANLLFYSISQTMVSCKGGNDGNISISVSGGTPNYSYHWNTGDTTSAIIGLSAGSYVVKVTDAKGCIVSDSISITQPANPLSFSISQTMVSCNGGNNGSASIRVSGGTPNYAYHWNTGDTASAITRLSAGNYTVKVTDAKGCIVSDSMSITQPANPLSFSISGNDSICRTETTVLTASVTGGTPAYSYHWMPGSYTGNTISVSPVSSTTYTTVVTDANGCKTGIEKFSVSVMPSPIALFDTVSNGFYNSSFLFNNLSSGGVSWLWTFGDGTSSNTKTPSHVFQDAGIYTVTQIAYSKFGCPDTFNLLIDCNEHILIPNVFTPDGDGVNDFWYIPNSGMEEFQVKIFDRWGVELFETTSDEIRWDGRTSAGKEVTAGTYFFTLKAIMKSIHGKRNYSTTGFITLLRGNGG